MSISDWSSDVCSSDLQAMPGLAFTHFPRLEADFARRGQPFIATPGFVPGIATVDERRHRHQLRTLLIKLPIVERVPTVAARSEERRGGKEGVSTVRSRWWAYH